MRQDKDRTAKWLLAHHGDSILRLAGMKGFTSWRALQSENVAPRRLPDGLLEVQFEGEREPTLVLVEVESYPGNDVDRQVLEDLEAVHLARGIVPEAICLVLRPKTSDRSRQAGVDESAQYDENRGIVDSRSPVGSGSGRPAGHRRPGSDSVGAARPVGSPRRRTAGRVPRSHCRGGRRTRPLGAEGRDDNFGGAGVSGAKVPEPFRRCRKNDRISRPRRARRVDREASREPGPREN